jgi:hypothetical protein
MMVICKRIKTVSAKIKMNKRALMVGINAYDQAPALSCCVDDASAMAKMFARHADGSLNYDCRTITSDTSRITESDLRGKIRELFSDIVGGDVIFYFSGHGMLSDTGGYLVTQDGQLNDQGYPMSELLQVANRAKVGSVLLILDCCQSGSIDGGYDQISLSEGVTILTASSPQQVAQQGLEHSLFTELLLDALDGGAADIRGRVSAASIYGYVEQSLGAWKQRPMYKSNARKLKPLRLCEPAVTDAVLRQLTTIFRSPTHKVEMNPSFEHTEATAIPANVAIFDAFKLFRNARLLRTCGGEDLYYAAMNSGSVELTSLGKFYWQQVSNNRI